MTCHLRQACGLCQHFVRQRDSYGHYKKHPYAWAYEMPTQPPAYLASGNLSYEMTHPGNESHNPIIKLCAGCLARSLGMKGGSP